jgi:hypothetical protein
LGHAAIINFEGGSICQIRKSVGNSDRERCGELLFRQSDFEGGSAAGSLERFHIATVTQDYGLHN